MFIDHTKKFIFVAVPKTATTTIQSYFNEHCDNKYDPGHHPYFMEWYHLSIDQILEIEPLIYNYYSFGFTRNPWDRMVSSWIEFTTDIGHLQVWSRDLPNDFKNFEDFILNFRNSKWVNDIHFQPSTWYLCNHLKVDFIGKYENINSDFRQVLSKIGFEPFDIISLNKARKSNRDNDYTKYYTNQQMIDAVGDYFHKDLVNFGYKF